MGTSSNDVTGRDEWITALALFVACRALRAQQPRPPLSDIEDMEQLLQARYPGFAASLRFAMI
jgi:hypothetical protein